MAWVRWIGGALALAFSVAVAAIALRPPAPTPEPAPLSDSAPLAEPSPIAEPARAPEAATPAQGVPTGQPMRLLEAIFEDQGSGQTWLRLRFVAPRIGEGAGRVPFSEAAADMEFLCRRVGLPVLERSGRPVVLIVVSLAAEETIFGESQPDVIQFFEAFRPESDDCIWEEY